MTSTLTMDFRDEFEAERTRWLRRRVLWYCGVFIGVTFLLLAVSTLAVVTGLDTRDEAKRMLVLSYFTSAPQFAVYMIGYVRASRAPLPMKSLLRLVYWMIVIAGLCSVISTPLYVRWGVPPHAQGAVAGFVMPVSMLNAVFYSHFFAALFIPWTPREAMRPLIPLLTVGAVMILVFSESTLAWRVGFVALSPLVGVPGVLIAWLRHSRFRQKFHFRMLRGHYGAMKRELLDARRIQEVLFPSPITNGSVRFTYRYEPMRQIGGDHLYARLDTSRGDDAPRLSVVLIDVTGHGIGAALTVNRIHGELERIFGERADLDPGDVITALNHYVNVALAQHSVYATALCVRADPIDGVVEWASAGHPPAFSLTVGGLIDRLEPTAFMLGVCRDGEFEPGLRRAPFNRGDTVIAYTDGVTESRGLDGRMLGIDGMQAIMARLDASRRDGVDHAETIFRAVQDHRAGAAADDTLIVEIARPPAT